MAAEVSDLQPPAQRRRRARTLPCGRCSRVLPITGRGLCRGCYSTVRAHGELDRWPRLDGQPFVPYNQAVNPLVCVCASPVADLRVNFGECATCRRKPLALFSAAALAGRRPRRRRTDA